METTTNGCEHGKKSQQMHAPISEYFAIKAWPSRVIGAVLLLVAMPLILLLVIIVRLTSRGPGLYKQTRTGRHGKEFHMYKIRTMYRDAEFLTGPTWCKPGDSRITPVGRILRILHLDELPQLINIVQGEMDLIGPRPERPAFVEILAREIPNYRNRLQVLPGVTGLAQINLPPDETVDCVRKKVVLDGDYIRTASFGLDLRIMICTTLRMIGIRHGRAVRWLQLERKISVPPTTPERCSAQIGRRVGQTLHLRADAASAGSHTGTTATVANPCEELEDVYAADIQEPAAVGPPLRRQPR